MSTLADGSLAGVLDALASSEPTPGAGPAAALTCSVAASLVEMVSAIERRGEAADSHGAGARAASARALRVQALALADADMEAYRAVLAVRRTRGDPGYGGRLRDALGDAADPPLAIAEAAAEVGRLAREAAEHARGGVRGEAAAAAALADAATAVCAAIVELNLAGAPDDPRLARVRELAGAQSGSSSSSASP
jgi:formiminotetrahydrofolate cyclodeaminase